MKKVTFIILFVSFILIWSCSKRTSSNPAGPSSGGQVDTTELKYDDGNPFSHFYWSVSDVASGVRMTIPAAKATYKLVGFSVHLGQIFAGNNDYVIYICPMSGSTPADTCIAYYEFTSGTENDWNKYYITSSDITFNGGEDFVIAMGWDGINQPSLGFDTTSNGRSWDYAKGQWTHYTNTYFIRAWVANQVTGEVIELSPSKSQLDY